MSKYSGNPLRWFAVIEMKRWMSPKGEREISTILQDIHHKLIPFRAENALMLIFADPQHNQRTAWLFQQLGIAQA